MATVSGGLLVYRIPSGSGEPEVLLAHPGGPFWKNRDEGSWSIPKGELEPGEDPLAAAWREFGEETGFRVEGNAVPLGTVRQGGGKVVHAWAVSGDVDPQALQSGSFEMEWPPRSGRTRTFPEVDRVQWFGLPEAAVRILPAQAAFLERLVVALHTER